MLRRATFGAYKKRVKRDSVNSRGCYMAEHVYMYSSANARCRFRVTRAMISDVIDMFGHDVTFGDETETHVTVSTRVNERAMWQFAKNFAPDVLILEPKRLADQVKQEAERTIAAYDEVEKG